MVEKHFSLYLKKLFFSMKTESIYLLVLRNFFSQCAKLAKNYNFVIYRAEFNHNRSSIRKQVLSSTFSNVGIISSLRSISLEFISLMFLFSIGTHSVYLRLVCTVVTRSLADKYIIYNSIVYRLSTASLRPRKLDTLSLLTILLAAACYLTGDFIRL